ncbi:MAG: T9SS type A sorting domain-containing protein [Chitinophagaceae bacterium]|nr:T9SS type A sorting domain-containing protein [Chitinophagaceae bacterium]
MKKSLRRTALKRSLLPVFVIASLLASAQEDNWNRKANFSGGVRMGAIGFSIGHKAYLGTGFGVGGGNSELKKDLWEYDPASNTWSQKADFPGGPRYSATGIAIGNKGYVGMGFASFYSNLTRDFWQYDPVKNVWKRKADFAGTPTAHTACFSIGTKGYVGTGRPDGGLSTNEFWEYDAAINKWKKKANFAGAARFGATGFSIGRKGYIGLGELGGNGVVFLNDFWEYNPAQDKWLQKAPFNGGGRILATGFSIARKGYMGLGSTLGIGGGGLKNDFWEYDPAFNTWTRKANYEGGTRQEAVGFAINDRGYIGTGGDIGENPGRADFWQYIPEGTKRNTNTVTIPGTANPWLAGMPNGTASEPGDFAPANSPVLVKLKLRPGSYIEISHVTGTTSHGISPIPLVGPEGCLNLDPCIFDNIAHEVGAEHGKSGLTAPISSLVGVFLDDRVPTFPAPAALNFSSPRSRDYFKLAPKLKQVFFIGNGRTSRGVQQKIVVPLRATRLFLGTMDGIEWNNNRGVLHATVKVEKRHNKFNQHKDGDMNISNASVLEGNAVEEETVHSFNISISPNPFRSNTLIHYEIPNDGHVSITLFDAYGRLLSTLANARHAKGVYTTALSSAGLANGMYYYQVRYTSNETGVQIKTGKIMLVR